LLFSEVFEMFRCQAHHAATASIQAMPEMDDGGKHVLRNQRRVMSIGVDNMVIIWRIHVQPQDRRGLIIGLLKLIQVN
jgi:hypothetical protein